MRVHVLDPLLLLDDWMVGWLEVKEGRGCEGQVCNNMPRVIV